MVVQIVPTYSITLLATSPRDVRSAVKQNTSFHKIKTWKRLYSTGAALHLKLSTNSPDKPNNLAEHPEAKDTDQKSTSIDIENHRQNPEKEIANLGERRQKSRQRHSPPLLTGYPVDNRGNDREHGAEQIQQDKPGKYPGDRLIASRDRPYQF